MLEKLGAQDITAFENQGKQCELSDHWKLKKKVFFKKKNNRGWHKKDKKIDRNKNVYQKSLQENEKTKVTHLCN